MKICSVCKRCFGEDRPVCVDPGHGGLTDVPHSVDIVPGYLLNRLVENSPATKIFEARQIEYGQDCFITIVAGDTQKFLADAQIAARLFHAGVGGVIESGELADRAAYAVSEAISGSSLREILAEGVPSLLDAISIARQAAEAVHALHAAGLRYGAMKPENVSVNGLGSDTVTVKIHNIDLGSAFAKSVLSNRFAMDASLDSIRYFAPEQFRGEDTGASSDVYGLGLLLYEVLAGHAPFEAASAAELIDMHTNQRVPDVTIETFDLRMLLTHTISESLQKQPSFRQSSADLFARQMRHIEQLGTHVSTPPPALAVTARVPASSPAPIVASVPTVTLRAAEQPAARHIEDSEVAPAVATVPATTVHAAEKPTPAVRYIEQQEIAPIPAIVVREEIQTERAVVAEPVPAVVPYVPSYGKRSRLKGMKKRLHDHVARAGAENAPAHSAPAPEARLIEWNQPEQDIPSVAAIMAELERTDQRPAVGTTGLFADDPEDEITAARSTSWRAAVDREPDQPATDDPRQGVGLFGTLPASGRKETGDLITGIAAYLAGIRRSSRGPTYVAVAIFCLAAGGLGLFSLGDSVTDTGYLGSDDAVGIQTPPITMRESGIRNESPAVELSNTERPTEEPVRGSSAPAVPEKAPTAVEILSKKGPEVAAEAAKPPVKHKEGLTPTRQGDKAIASQANPLKPSTMVISASAGKPKVIVVSDAPPFGSAKLATEMRNRAGSTRPRIVTVPP